MINYIKQNLTEVKRGIIPHGVNCQAVMGSGVAKALKDKYPRVYEQYMQVGKENAKLGMIDVVILQENNLYVVNCYTQDFYGRGGRYAVPSAILACLDLTFRFAENLSHDPLPIYMPKIGCGLGGLSWKQEIEPVIKKLGDKFPQLTINVCEI